MYFRNKKPDNPEQALISIGTMAMRGCPPEEIAKELDLDVSDVRRIVKEMNLEGGLF